MSKERMKNSWIIEVQIKGEPQPSLRLFDANSVFGEDLTLNRNYFDQLITLCKQRKEFVVGKGIEHVTGKDGEDWTYNPWILLLAKDNEKKAPFWVLIKRETDLTGVLVALGPELFKTYLASNKENIETMRKILEYILVYPEKWALTVLVPNILE
ncbi:MAG: hypothetical protein ACTSU2_12495 [Promethearchaeota archaeon]